MAETSFSTLCGTHPIRSINEVPFFRYLRSDAEAPTLIEINPCCPWVRLSAFCRYCCDFSAYPQANWPVSGGRSRPVHERCPGGNSGTSFPAAAPRCGNPGFWAPVADRWPALASHGMPCNPQIRWSPFEVLLSRGCVDRDSCCREVLPPDRPPFRACRLPGPCGSPYTPRPAARVAARCRPRYGCHGR